MYVIKDHVYYKMTSLYMTKLSKGSMLNIIWKEIILGPNLKYINGKMWLLHQFVIILQVLSKNTLLPYSLYPTEWEEIILMYRYYIVRRKFFSLQVIMCHNVFSYSFLLETGSPVSHSVVQAGYEPAFLPLSLHSSWISGMDNHVWPTTYFLTYRNRCTILTHSLEIEELVERNYVILLKNTRLLNMQLFWVMIFKWWQPDESVVGKDMIISSN